jgi:transcriptional regulator with XRE-family HTH domain
MRRRRELVDPGANMLARIQERGHICATIEAAYMQNPKTIICRHCKGTGQIKFSAVLALRKRAGLSQGAVARAIGTTQSNYSRIESGETSPLYQARKLADLFKVSTGVILGREPIPQPKPARPARAPAPARIAASKRRRAGVARKNRKATQ